MAENLIWLANDRYKGRRVIVWAATFHALHEPSAIKLGAGSSFSYQDVVTMGKVARKLFGRHIYTIGFTAANGKAGNPMGSQTVELKTQKMGRWKICGLALGTSFRLWIFGLCLRPTGFVSRYLRVFLRTLRSRPTGRVRSMRWYLRKRCSPVLRARWHRREPC
jgi:hypothetical protein